MILPPRIVVTGVKRNTAGEVVKSARRLFLTRERAEEWKAELISDGYDEIEAGESE